MTNEAALKRSQGAFTSKQVRALRILYGTARHLIVGIMPTLYNGDEQFTQVSTKDLRAVHDALESLRESLSDNRG